MSVFHFGVHRFRLVNNPGVGLQHGQDIPQHIISVDHPHPIEERVRVQAHPDDVNLFCIEATLDNDQEVNIRYSVSVWCGETEVADIHDQEAAVAPRQWFHVCDIILSEAIGAMQERGLDSYLRVSLTVVGIGNEDKLCLDEDARREEPRILRARQYAEQARRRHSQHDRHGQVVMWWVLWAVTGKIIQWGCGVP